MTRRIAASLLSAGFLLTVLVAGTPSEAKKKVFPEDKGPKTINVSKYPPKMQSYYKLFAKKCSKCHTLARPINSKKATQKDWEAYIAKMRKKPNSGIGKAEADRILQFLVYDGKVRKLKGKSTSK